VYFTISGCVTEILKDVTLRCTFDSVLNIDVESKFVLLEYLDVMCCLIIDHASDDFRIITASYLQSFPLRDRWKMWAETKLIFYFEILLTNEIHQFTLRVNLCEGF